MSERSPRGAPRGRPGGNAGGRSGRPPRDGGAGRRDGGAGRRDGGAGRRDGDARRRRFPSVQITVAADDRDLERLTARHRVVELSSSAAGPLTERTLGFLVDRTPDGFRVDVRAHRLLTQHPAPIESLWADVRDKLPANLRGKPQLFPDELPPAVLDATLDRFVAQIKPLHEFDKLGAIVFQFPSYFSPGPRALDYLVWLRDRCGDLAIAVELRRREWVDTKNREATLAFLSEHRLAYVCVDAPQGTETSVPPLAAATTDLAIVRMHGRNLEAWERSVDDPLAHLRYEYRRADLEPWIPRIEKLAAGGHAVHVVIATAPADAAARNASLLLKTLTEPPGTAPEAPPPRSGPPRRRR
jgi:uncharacterized protein YecE (DUF72 family)